MALADIVLNDGKSTPVAHTFSVVRVEGQKVVRKDMAADPEEPLMLTLGHQDRVVAGNKVTSHLFRIDRSTLDADGVTTYVDNVRVMADIHNKTISEDIAEDFAAYIRNWFTEANMLLWMKGSSA